MGIDSENVSFIPKNASDVSSIFGDDKSEWTTRYGEAFFSTKSKIPLNIFSLFKWWVEGVLLTAVSTCGLCGNTIT